MPRGRDGAHMRPEEAGETRQALLRAARDLFMQRGYRAVSTRQIADACGLTQPALYRHFADKQELYVAVLEDELETMRLGLERIASRSIGVGERLRQVIRFLPTSRQDMGQMFHDIANEIEPEARQRLQDSFERSMVAPIAAIFEDGIRHGMLLDPEHGGVYPVAAAYLFLSMLQRPARQYGHSPSPPEQHADVIVHVLLHGLLAPGARDAGDAASGAEGSN